MAAPLNLLCLPYAGGNASVYREWSARMPGWVNVIPLHMPGRGVRQRMAPVHEWKALLDLLVDDVRTDLGRPFAIFGHSMGALIGVELAYELRDRYRVSPVWFGASACIAPSRREREDKWLDCPADELFEEIKSLNGTADELLGNPELMALVTPMLRADFHLCGTHHYRKRLPLQCPMLVLGGTRDEDVVKDRDNLLAWSEETSGPVSVEMLEADHFFINTHRSWVIDKVSSSLERDSLLRPISRSNPQEKKCAAM